MAAASWEMQATSLLLLLHPSEKGDPPRKGMFPPPPLPPMAWLIGGLPPLPSVGTCYKIVNFMTLTQFCNFAF